MQMPESPQMQGGLFYVPGAVRDSYDIRPTNNGGPINWQPWRQPPAPEYGIGAGVGTYSNVAAPCEGEQNRQDDAVIVPRMVDFHSELEKSIYLDGFGLPAEGASPEGRLSRALNMVCFYSTLV